MQNHWQSLGLYVLLLSPLQVLSIADIQHQISNEQKQRQRQEAQQIEQLLNKPIQLQTHKKSAAVSMDLENCLEITDIQPSVFVNLSARTRLNIINPYQNRCLDMPGINQLIDDINKHYQQQGWFGTQAGLQLPQTQLQSGVLQLKIYEGLLEDIHFDDSFSSPELKKQFLFADQINKTLNIRSLERRLEQINRLHSYQAKISIKPGTKEQHSQVLIQNHTQEPKLFSLDINNAGSKATGENKARLNMAQEDLLMPFDRLNLEASQSLDVNKTQQFSDGYTFNYQVPYQDKRLEYNTSKSDYRTNQVLSSGDILYSLGQTKEHSLFVSQELARSNQSKERIKLGLTLRDEVSEVEILDVRTRNEAGSRKLSIASLSYQKYFYFKDKTLLLNPSIRVGLSGLGALDDKHVDYQQKAQFNSIGLYGHWSVPIEIGGQNVHWRSTWDMQYSKNDLFGSEQFGVGGEHSVRGFKDESISSKSGFWLQNEWILPAKTSMETNLTVRPSVFVDYAQAYQNRSLKHTLSGAGIKLLVQHPNANLSLTLAKAINTPDALVKEDWVSYLSINTQF